MPVNAVLFLSRLLLAGLFIPSGVSTLRNIEGSASYFASLALPAPLATAWIVGLFEVITGIFILAGGLTRIVAIALALFCLATAYIGHYSQGADDATLATMHWQAMMKDIAISGGLLALAIAGAGQWSIDGRRR